MNVKDFVSKYSKNSEYLSKHLSNQWLVDELNNHIEAINDINNVEEAENFIRELIEENFVCFKIIWNNEETNGIFYYLDTWDTRYEFEDLAGTKNRLYFPLNPYDPYTDKERWEVYEDFTQLFLKDKELPEVLYANRDEVDKKVEMENYVVLINY